MSSFKSNLVQEGMMVGEEDNRPQGFVILVIENCRANNWARIYLSRIKGEKIRKTCGPDRLEISSAVEELLQGCRRVVFLTQAYPKGNPWELFIRDIESEYSQKIEVVRIPHVQIGA